MATSAPASIAPSARVSPVAETPSGSIRSLLVDLSQIVMALLTVLGVPLVAYQLTQVKSEIRDNTVVSVYESANGITLLLKDISHSRDFFYMDDRTEGAASRDARLRTAFAGLSADERAKLLYAAEYMADNFEQMYWLHANLPPADWAVWLKYFQDTYRDCYLLRELYETRKDWYNLDDVLRVSAIAAPTK